MRKILKWSQFSSILEAQTPGFETEDQSLSPDRKQTSRMAKDKLSWCLMQLMAKTPWWGEFATKLKFREDWNLPFKTMATNGYELIYDPEFVLKKRKAEIIWVIAHEIMHCVLRHHERKQVNHMVWNAACDYALNQLIQPESFESVRGNEKGDSVKVEIPAGCLGGPEDNNPHKSKFIGKSAEQIYQYLIDNNIQLPPEQGWNYGGVNPKPPTPPKRGEGGGAAPVLKRNAKVGDFITLADGSFAKIMAIDGATGNLDVDPMTEAEVKAEIESMSGKKVLSIR